MFAARLSASRCSASTLGRPDTTFWAWQLPHYKSKAATVKSPCPSRGARGSPAGLMTHQSLCSGLRMHGTLRDVWPSGHSRRRYQDHSCGGGWSRISVSSVIGASIVAARIALAILIGENYCLESCSGDWYRCLIPLPSSQKYAELLQHQRLRSEVLLSPVIKSKEFICYSSASTPD